MRRLKKRVGNRLAKVRYYDKNTQNAATEEEVEVVTEETAEVEETEEVAEEVAEEVETVEAAESAEEVETEETAEAAEPETAEETAEVEPEVIEEAEVAGTNEPEVIEEVGEITEPAETTEEEEEINAIEEVAEAVEPEEETETTTEVEDVEEVPLEYAEEETDAILEEEGSLDGSEDEVAALAEKAEEEEAEVQEALKPEAVEEVEIVGTDEPEVIEEVGKITEPAETTEEEEEINAIEEVAEAVEPETENTETTEEVEAVEEVAEEPTEAEKAEELAVTAAEELAEAETEEAEEVEEATAEEKPAEKEVFKLTPPSNLEEILAGICVKRGRKLIYRPNEILFNETATVIGTDKNNEEGIKIKNILDEEIKQGVKLGYIDKYDGLKMSEIKEEYENDTVYEYAEQEFKRTGLLLEGDKVKVYIYDWDMKALHHVGYIEGEEAEAVKPYLIDSEKYSFDICGLITGGKYRKVIKDESGKVTVEKGNDGKLGVELDISVIARKD